MTRGKRSVLFSSSNPASNFLSQSWDHFPKETSTEPSRSVKKTFFLWTKSQPHENPISRLHPCLNNSSWIADVLRLKKRLGANFSLVILFQYMIELQACQWGRRRSSWRRWRMLEHFGLAIIARDTTWTTSTAIMLSVINASYGSIKAVQITELQGKQFTLQLGIAWFVVSNYKKHHFFFQKNLALSQLNVLQYWKVLILFVSLIPIKEKQVIGVFRK